MQTWNMLLLGVGGIWVGIIGEIWNHRNIVAFKNEHVDLVEDFTVVQRRTWSWITVKENWLISLTRIGVWNPFVVWNIWEIDVWWFMFNVLSRFGSCGVFCKGFLGFCFFLTRPVWWFWSWVTVKEILVDLSYLNWCLEPLCCIRYFRDWCLVILV